MEKVPFIAILTLNGNSNFGNRLQNYALQQVLLKYGDSVDTLLIEDTHENVLPNKNKFSLHSFLLRIKKLSFTAIVEKCVFYGYVKIVGKHIVKKRISDRQKLFLAFSRNTIHEVDVGLSKNTIPSSIEEQYDYFVVGSDQVWNPTFPEFSELFFLSFTRYDKRIAYAPSFGVDQLPINSRQQFAYWLNGIPYLSVREEAGAHLIKKLIGKEVPVVLDPTLLLTKDDWLKIASPSSNIPQKKYVLLFFLGELHKDLNKQIQVFAKDNSMEIVRINDIRSKYYAIGPSELVSFINNSSLILTDSFHGTVFSLLFEKPFLTYKRSGSNNMYSRIETLFSKFNIQHRIGMTLADKNLWNIDYVQVNQLLEIERKKAFAYLSTCFHGSSNHVF